MLEGLAAWVLNTYLGEYVENLNTDQLSIGLLSGAVELENLPLRKDALQNIDLPVEVKTGFIGKIHLQIPAVRALRSDPWVISLEKLYLVAGPSSNKKCDVEEEAERLLEKKRQQLAALEEDWKRKCNSSQSKDGGSSWYAYSTSMIYNILENLQLKIKDIHIRYEDDVTVPSQSVACGISIGSLSAEGLNQSGEQKEDGMSFKLLSLDNLSVYWDTDAAPLGNLAIHALKEALERNLFVSHSTGQFVNHEYILEPISAKAKVRRNLSTKPLRSRNAPRFLCDADLERIQICLSEDQYHGLVAVMKEFERADRARPFRKWRPTASVKESPKEWWKFAMRSTQKVLEDKTTTLRPEVSSKFKLMGHYYRAYYKQLEGETLDGEEMEKMAQAERELSFIELRTLREGLYDELEEKRKAMNSQSTQQEGIMQRWVWGWGSSWYSQPNDRQDQSSPPLSSSPSSPPPIDEDELRDIIGDPEADSNLLKRDNVFALLNFNLEGGSLKLAGKENQLSEKKSDTVEGREDSLSSSRTSQRAGQRSKDRSPSSEDRLNSTIVELEFSGVKVNYESRLRTNSSLFSAKLGGLFVRDMVTKGSLFPTLISPQRKEESSIPKRQQFGLFSKHQTGSYMEPSMAYKKQRTDSEAPLFEMAYESHPPSSPADYRLEITTQPLDMIYNPDAMQRVSSFFTSKSEGMSGLTSRASELKLAETARIRYEELKNQTKQDLIETLDTLLEGEEENKVKRWDVQLEIAAPQIIIPDSFHRKDATLVVLDFGRLQLTSNTAVGRKKSETPTDIEVDDNEDLDDDFCTPLSTPPSEYSAEDEAMVTMESLTETDLGSELTQEALRDKLYDSYTLNLCDLQVMVGRATDNWKMAHTRSQSQLQVVEKFNISIKVERRLMFTTDPQWPSATLSGTIPSLAIHVNEPKILALNHCLALLKDSDKESGLDDVSVHGVFAKPEAKATDTSCVEEETFTQKTQALLEESRLLETEFCVDKISLEVQSRSRTIVELQVSGAKANLTKRPYDTSISLTVHSLLLIDALQQFGPGFELLVASHKDLSIHAPSGSIVDSETSTPRSPVSPQSPASPVERTPEVAQQLDLASRLAQAGRNLSAALKPASASSRLTGPDSSKESTAVNNEYSDSEALITANLFLINPKSPTNSNGDTPSRVASVHFNNLDVMANQETIVELMSFFKQVMPTDLTTGPKSRDSTLVNSSTMNSSKDTEEESTKMDLVADFHRLNVVLMKRERENKVYVGQKVATVTISDAHVQASTGESQWVRGHLGGLQLLDVTPEGTKYQQIFSVGQDPDHDTTRVASSQTGVHPESKLNLYQIALQMAKSSDGESLEEELKACNFHWTKNANSSEEESALAFDTSAEINNSNVFQNKNLLDVQLASLCYTHVPRFLHALSKCFDEFQSSVTQLAGSIQKVASAAAKDFIRAEIKSEHSLTPSVFDTMLESPTAATGETSQDSTDVAQSSEEEAEWQFEIFMQSPVIIIPKSPQSSELLVGRLGNIKVEKKEASMQASSSWSMFSTPLKPVSVDQRRILVNITDMNIFSFNAEDFKQAYEGGYKNQAPPLHSNDYFGTEILQNTSIEIVLNRGKEQVSDTSLLEDSEKIDETEPLISGKVLHPLRVVLSKHIYEQVLETVDNLTYRPPQDKAESREHSPDNGNPDEMFLVRDLDSESKPMDEDDLESQTVTSEAATEISVKFDLPKLEIELKGDLSDGEQGLVLVSFQNFHVDFEKPTSFLTSITMSLESLRIEDLLKSKQRVQHKYIVISHDGKGDPIVNPPKMYHSTSCPSMVEFEQLSQFKPSSLPSSLDQPLHPQYQLPPTFRPFLKTSLYPSTPPPSLDISMEEIISAEERDPVLPKQEALVHIRALFVDEDCPEFESRYRKVNNSIDVDFNALDITINQQTWVVLLDFLGIGTAVKGESKREKDSKELMTESSIKADQVTDAHGKDKTTEMRIHMASLSLILNKPEYELAKANVSVVTANVIMKEGNMDVSGKLGKISLSDLTPHGKLYPERFFTKGEEAVSFHFFKYGTPDDQLRRDFDMSLQLRMSSVRYIHTARFQREVVAFFDQFNQLQDMLGRIRASTAGREVDEGPRNKARVKLDVQAGSPVILAPISSRSKELLVINLGNLTLTNCFLFAGSKGTISKFSSKVSPRGERTPKSGPLDQPDRGETRKNVVYQSPPPGLAGPLLEENQSASIRGRGNLALINRKSSDQQARTKQPNKESQTKQGKQESQTKQGDEGSQIKLPRSISDEDPLDHDCLLDCININLVDMDLFSSHRVDHKEFDPRDATALIFPSFVVARKGFKLLEQTCMLKLQVERNLSDAISRAVPDMSVAGKLSSVHCCIDVHQYQLIRGMLEHNLGEPLEEFQNAPKPENPVNQTVLSGQVWTNICMNIDLANVTLEICDVMTEEDHDTKERHSIAKANFNESQFSFESFSNDSITVDLVSHAIRAHDTRRQDKSKHRSNVFQEVFTPTKHHSRTQNPLQLELHYNSNAESMKGTILLNNMRVICVMDLMLAVKDFLLDYDSQSFKTEATSSKNSEASHSKSTSSTLGTEGVKTNVPVAVGTGIVTKRVIREDEGAKNQEFRINITETEFVIMENTALVDSGAVILKSTCAVLVYMPQSKENPFFCSLEGLETFSCFMNNEQETALSIINPATVNFQLKGSPSHLNQRKVMRGGLSDITDGHAVLEVHTEALNIRVSYHDAQLFLGIMNSLPEQLKQVSVAALEKELQSSIERISPQDKYKQSQLRKLMELGFKLEDCQRALSESHNQLDQAASWLLSHAQPSPENAQTHSKPGLDEKKLEIAGVEVRAASFSICLIDDCGDSDVPLLELSLQNLDIFQKLLQNFEGRAYGVLSGDYYNRAISGWEPFLEPWRCKVEWVFQEERKILPEKLFIQMEVDDCLDINITRELLDLYTNTKNSWTEDYYQSRSSDSSQKRRSPFVPFALRNLTGCRLWFATVTTAPNRVIESPEGKSSRSHSPFGSWEEVMPNAVCPFSFEGRGKQRHGQTHELLAHQLVVRVEGWEQLPSVSVDKVGTYFREVRPQKSQIDIGYQESSPARIVFVVTLEGSARKLITVHSALTVKSRLSEPVELQLINPDNKANKIALPLLDPNGSIPIPLQMINWDIYVRPYSWGTDYCSKPLTWKTVTRPGESQTILMECRFGANFKFCAFVKHHRFPEPTSNKPLQPGHTITLIPPVVLTNLLPVDLTFHHEGNKGEIRPGKDQPLYLADLNNNLDISFSFENFTKCVSPLSVPGRFMQDSYARITMKDESKRTLYLMARIECRAGRCLKIYISAFYWLINLSGLPLIFKQDRVDTEAAGQTSDHEVARSVAPLMFSYTDSDFQELTMRLGKGKMEPGAYPLWCNKVSLEGGAGVRAVRVGQPHNKPCKVYHIGIDIRPGRGRYRDTTIVTFVPRFQLENRSKHNLAIAQKHFVSKEGTSLPKEHLVVIRDSSLTFHWPRDDLDKLLCVKHVDLPQCRWSGGMCINKPGSVNINMRGPNNECKIMHVEIRLQGATYFVVFSDADELPPPYRIDNLSEVNVTFWQNKVESRSLKTLVHPLSSVPYAFDEPVLPNLITCEVQGGSHATYNMNKLELGESLYYENFIYIAMSQTFESPADSQMPLRSTLFGGQIWSGSNLVLDVPHPGSHVVLRKKEPGKRSQLWRMTTTGMLQNEAFITPREPNSPGRQSRQCMVLDIMSSAPVYNGTSTLVLRSPAASRKSTQTWSFEKDGTLRCLFASFAVQPKYKVLGLKEGAEMVLGPAQTTRELSPDTVPTEMAIERQKNLPGSGSLSVRVMTDGPTRVLQIMDIMNHRIIKKASAIPGSVGEDFETYTSEAIPQEHLDSVEDKPSKRGKNLEVVLCLKEGIGVSIINHQMEELVYASFKGIDVHFNHNNKETDLKAGIKKMQIDNQMHQAKRPVVLYMTREDDQLPSQALNLSLTTQNSELQSVDLFKRFILSIGKLNLNIEELLLMKLLEFAGFSQSDSTIEKMDEAYYDNLRTMVTEPQSKRYYFEFLRINSLSFYLSVLKYGNLPKHLQALRHQLHLILVQFEDAPVALDDFVSQHQFETEEFFLDAIKKHYNEELRSQAIKILGSVDFLGNPIGLLQDIRDGLKELVFDRSVTGLVKNVTHGVSNSAAKFTGSISDGVGTMSLDQHHQEVRSAIRGDHDGSTVGHLSAGLKGFAFGVIGGLTSVLTQPIQGASEEGVGGFVKGVGKGVVGTITKPAAGVLDLASGALNAVRSTTDGESNMPARIRPPRCGTKPGGGISRYSVHDAKGYDYVLKLSDGARGERYFALETVRQTKPDGLIALITDRATYFLSYANPKIPVLKVEHKDLIHARRGTADGKFFIELTRITTDGSGHSGSTSERNQDRPKVVCDNEKIAKKVSQQINYAKSCSDELKQEVKDTSDDMDLTLVLDNSVER